MAKLPRIQNVGNFESQFWSLRQLRIYSLEVDELR